MPPSKAVGIIGAGALGSALIDLLIAKGFAVTVFDPSPDACKRATEAGATSLEDAKSVFALGCPVISCVASQNAFKATINAALQASERGGAVVGPVIEMSTIDPPLKEEARVQLRKVGTVLLDCPASGTSAQARQGDLIVLASGDPLALATCNDIFDAIARKTIQAGEFGMGMKLKLLANHLVALNSAAAGEAMMLARKAGLDLQVTLDALIQSAGQSRMLEVRGPQMIAQKYLPAPGAVDIIVKDGKMIHALAQDNKCVTPMFDRAHGLYEELQAKGYGEHDVAVIHDYLLQSPSEVKR